MVGSPSPRAELERWRLREVTRADNDGLAELSKAAADGGRVAFALRHRVPVVDGMRLRRPSSRGVVALAPDGTVVGAAWVSLGGGRIGAGVRPVALLNSLAVHPQWRGRGIATELTRWRLGVVGEEHPDAVVVAAIQAGNEASEANARSWATQAIGSLVVTPTPVARRPPPARSGLVVRRARLDDEGEVEQIVEGLAQFTGTHLMAPVVSADDLREWGRLRLADDPVHLYWVLAERTGRVVAGLGIEREALFADLAVVRMPALTRVASRALGVVPDDGVLRNLNVTMAWFAPGHQRAAHHLWQSMRWLLRTDGTTLVDTTDRDSDVQKMIRTPPWAPRTSLQIVARSAQRLPSDAVLGLSI